MVSLYSSVSKLSMKLIYIIRRKIGELILSTLFDHKDFKAFDSNLDYPSVILRDNTKLTSHWSYEREPILGIPLGYEQLLLDYISRYRYSHFLPQKNVSNFVSLLPYKLASKLGVPLHRQHFNTFNEFNLKDRRFLRKSLSIKRGEVVWELGAFIGFGTIQMARTVGSEGKVVSVEASPHNFDILTRNVEDNELFNVHSLNLAVGVSDKDEVKFWSTKRQANTLSKDLLNTSEYLKVKTATFNGIEKKTQTIPDFIIMTINGFELRVLESNIKFLQKLKFGTRIIAPGWYSDKEGPLGKRIEKLLQDQKFRVYRTRGNLVFAVKCE